jgi:hypothetical protein
MGVWVGVTVGLSVAVCVGVFVGVADANGVFVTVRVGVAGVSVRSTVAVGVHVAVGGSVWVGVSVWLGGNVAVGLSVAVAVAAEVAVGAVCVDTNVKTCEYVPPLYLRRHQTCVPGCTVHDVGVHVPEPFQPSVILLARAKSGFL